MPVFLLLFLEDLLETGRKEMKFLRVLYLVNAAVCLSLHLFRILPLYRTILSQHVLILVTMAVVLKECVSELRRFGRKELKKILLGFSLLCIFGVAALVEFYLHFETGIYPYLYSLGILLLMLCLLDAGLGKSFYYMEWSLRLEAYKRLAYVDAMTGLGNRAAYQDMEKQGIVVKKPVYIMMDINNLKAVNDRHGHQAGDELIEDAAECIQSTFREAGHCYRLGGDEFLVILDGASREQVESFLDELEDRIVEMNRTREIPIEVAWGYARAEDEDASSEQLFREADERMYQKKQSMKGNKLE